ncbi:MAG TPA: hypothetical protein PKE04_05320, partial [Clostridia bacterium]|nr:hypothetical protein [Clostridia bacterium]
PSLIDVRADRFDRGPPVFATPIISRLGWIWQGQIARAQNFWGLLPQSRPTIQDAGAHRSADAPYPSSLRGQWFIQH